MFYGTGRVLYTLKLEVAQAGFVYSPVASSRKLVRVKQKKEISVQKRYCHRPATDPC